MSSKPYFACLVAAGMLALSACGSTAPRQIASYPVSPPAAPEPGYTGDVVTTSADIDLVVGDVDYAADSATQLAYEHGGYPSSSRSWYQDGNKHILLELSVPATRFDSLRRRLLELGTLVADRISNEVVDTGDAGGARNRMTQVSLHLQPSSLAPLFDVRWNPARTFASAFNVVASIFRVVVDILIWVLVVAGPFVLIGLGVRLIVRRARRPHVH